MIKIRGELQNGDPLIFFGLSHENLDRLRADKPIRVDLAELGLRGLVCIFAGETEEAMQDEFLASFAKAYPETPISDDEPPEGTLTENPPDRAESAAESDQDVSGGKGREKAPHPTGEGPGDG